MGSLTTDYVESFLDQVTAQDAPYLALFTSSPGDSGDVTDEVGASGYAREDLNDTNDKWETAGNTNDREINTDEDVEFAEASESWGTVSHIGLAESGSEETSDLKVWGALSTSKTIDSGDQLVFKAGNITLSVASG